MPPYPFQFGLEAASSKTGIWIAAITATMAADISGSQVSLRDFPPTRAPEGVATADISGLLVNQPFTGRSPGAALIGFMIVLCPSVGQPIGRSTTKAPEPCARPRWPLQSDDRASRAVAAKSMDVED